MLFREKLYECTKESHKVVDRHNFVNLIRTNKEAGELYINMNKICISYIQKEIQKRLEDPDSEFESFRVLFGKLYKDININFYVSPKMHLLLNSCKKYPLEHAYMFILGLLFGGKLLSKYLPNHIEFLKYDNSKELISEFKDYLDNNVTNHDQFINIVNDSYKLISEIFDEFYLKVEGNIIL
jgi:hypothetical protein